MPLQYVVAEGPAAAAAVGLNMSMVSIGLDESISPDTPGGGSGGSGGGDDDDNEFRAREGSMISIGLTDEAPVSPVPEAEEEEEEQLGVPQAEAGVTSN